MNRERDLEIALRAASDETFASIASDKGLSVARVRNIFLKELSAAKRSACRDFKYITGLPVPHAETKRAIVAAFDKSDRKAAWAVRAAAREQVDVEAKARYSAFVDSGGSYDTISWQ